MKCAWKELLGVLPEWMRSEVDALGSEAMQELRLRLKGPPELVFQKKSLWLDRRITQEDLNHILNTGSRYSPWAAATQAKGYLTLPGGHRMGLCGEAVVHQGTVTGLKHITSLCIRVARDFPGIAAGAAGLTGSVLILGPPGWGKTTLLRDLIRYRGGKEHICVVDERGEIFPAGLPGPEGVDVLTGCSKAVGIPMVLRTMGPEGIAVDEITDPGDVEALIRAANCGVQLLATAHGSSVEDLHRRRGYRPLLEHGVFDGILVLNRDRSYTVERMTQCFTKGSVRY